MSDVLVSRLRACAVDRDDPDVLGIESLMRVAAAEIERLSLLAELSAREAERLRGIQEQSNADWVAIRADLAHAIGDRDAARTALRGLAMSIRSQGEAALEFLKK